MRYIFSSPYYLKCRATGANKRFESILYSLQEEHEVGIVVVKDQVPTQLDSSVLIYQIPKFVAKYRFLTFVYLNVLYLYLSFGNNIVISDFNPIPASLFFSKKQFQLIHDARIFDNFGRWSSFSSKLMKLQWKYVKSKVVVSKFTKNSLCERLSIDPESIVVSYNGINPNAINCVSKAEKEIDLLYVATFEERKNHSKLIEALHLVNTPLSVTFLGKDLGLKSDIEKEASKLDNHNVVFLDAVSDSDLTRLYGKSKVFISPSLYEGFGMPILEAYCYGCVVLCSDIFVFHEVLGENATYFDATKSKDIAEAINNAFTSYDNYYKKEDEVEKRFYWDNISKRLIDELGNRLT